MKRYGATIQKRPIEEYFHMASVDFQYNRELNLWFFLNFDFGQALEE